MCRYIMMREGISWKPTPVGSIEDAGVSWVWVGELVESEYIRIPYNNLLTLTLLDILHFDIKKKKEFHIQISF